jgi:hypothetical protein
VQREQRRARVRAVRAGMPLPENKPPTAAQKAAVLVPNKVCIGVVSVVSLYKCVYYCDACYTLTPLPLQQAL